MTAQNSSIDAVAAEFSTLRAQFEQWQPGLSGEASEQVLESYLMTLSMLSETLQMVGLEGLSGCLDRVAENLMLVDPEQAISQQLHNFARWTDLTQAHLRNVLDPAPCIDWANLLEHEDWPSPMDIRESRHLIEQFAQDQQRLSADEADSGPEYQLDDLTTCFADTTDSEVLEAFLQDTPNQLEDLSQQINQFDLGNVNSQNVHTLQGIQRISHTIKGSANLVGITAMAWLAHELESFFEQLIEGCLDDPAQQWHYHADAKDICMATADTLQSLLDNAENQADDDSEFAPILTALAAWPSWPVGHSTFAGPDSVPKPDGAMSMPVEVKPIETKPIETKPIETKPIETKSIKSMSVATKPVETKPVETKSVATKSVATKPPEAMSVEAMSVEAMLVEAMSIKVEPIETKSVEVKPIETKPVKVKPIETKPIKVKPIETKPIETKPIETKPVAAKLTKTKPIKTMPPGNWVNGGNPDNPATAAPAHPTVNPVTNGGGGPDDHRPVSASTLSSPPNAASEAPAADQPTPAAMPAPERRRLNDGDEDVWVELVEEMSINLVQSQELFKRVDGSLRELKDHDLRIQERRFELENAVDSRSMAQANVTTDNPEFDALEMDTYDDIHRSAHQFIEAIADNREMVVLLQKQISLFDGLVRQQRRFTEQFQHQVMRSSQQTFASLKSRLQRCVRQAARFTNKAVDLFISGDDIRVDRAIVTALADPLMHLLRNSVDHGIEAERGTKPATGRIELTFRVEQRHIEIQLRDDGGGIDAQAVTEGARRRGLIPDDAHLSDPLQLIFASGVTSRASVTQLSGRGIGLDAVAFDVKKLEGNIRAKSTPQQGTEFIIRIPLRQVTRHMIVVSLGEESFAIDSTRIVQIIPPDESVAEQKGEQWIVTWQGQWLPFKEIHSALGLAPYPYAKGPIRHPLLLIEYQNKTAAVAIDRLQNSFELVLKSLGQYVPSIAGLAGITQTGDGQLVPVLNIEQLLERGTAGLAQVPSQPDTQAARQTILVVDDSLSQRNALKLLLVDSGFQVQTATDGIDALEKIRLELPAVMLVDMEMPRMNGLELTQATKSQSATSHIPVVMITSRSQAKHRQQAKAAGVDDYLTKPFNENEVVDTVLALLAQLPSNGSGSQADSLGSQSDGSGGKP